MSGPVVDEESSLAFGGDGQKGFGRLDNIIIRCRILAVLQAQLHAHDEVMFDRGRKPFGERSKIIDARRGN